jgi:SOS-response transcriptional repressor LexA
MKNSSKSYTKSNFALCVQGNSMIEAHIADGDLDFPSIYGFRDINL